MAANGNNAIQIRNRERVKEREVRGEISRELVAVAPLRIDLTGGFTDVPPFSLAVDCLHINAAIDIEVRVRCRTRLDRELRIDFSDGESTDSTEISPGRRRFLQAIYRATKEFTAEHGFDLSISSDAPAGSGLGSSGAILVAAISGCAKLAGETLSPMLVAEKAIAAARVADIVGGRQDEFAAVHGSLRAYLFDRNGDSSVVDLGTPAACKHLEESLLVVQPVARGRRADTVSEVTEAVRTGKSKTIAALHLLQRLARDLLSAMERECFAEIPQLIASIRDAQYSLHSSIACPFAIQTMEAARKVVPQLQYKTLGGGGTGSCMLVHIPRQSASLAVALLARHAKRVFRVKLRHQGVAVRSPESNQLALD